MFHKKFKIYKSRHLILSQMRSEEEPEERIERIYWRCRFCGEIMRDTYDEEEAIGHTLRHHPKLVDALIDYVWQEEVWREEKKNGFKKSF